MKRFVNIFTRFCVVAFVAAIILPACTKGTPVAETVQKDNNPYLIPLDKALESLNGFLQSEDLTKAGGQMREIESVSTIRSRSIATRSDIDINDNEELLYVVNFKNNLGYAVLAADSRLQDKIIAVTEAGKLNPSLFDKPQTKFVNHVAVLDTTNFYYGDYNDWFTGDYFDVESNANNSNEEFITEIISDYVAGQRGGIHPPTPGIGDLDDIVIEQTIRYSNPVVEPLVDNTKYWSQSVSPYVDDLPFIFSHFGCVNLALARLFAHCEYPSNWYVNDDLIVWSTIKTNPLSSTGSYLIKRYFKSIIEQTFNLSFGNCGTFTLPASAAALMVLKGYSNVLYGAYNENTIKTFLMSDSPVFICSVPSTPSSAFDLSKSHAWIIDGYLNRTTTTITFYYVGGILDHTSTSTMVDTMFHCDWGWETSSNGYFVSNLFNFTSNSMVYDAGVNTPSRTSNYNRYLKIITYNNPNS